MRQPCYSPTFLNTASHVFFDDAVTVIGLYGYVEIGGGACELLPGERVLWEELPYQVTNYRTIIGGDTPWSAYLDQVDRPVIREQPDGIVGLLIEPARHKRHQRWFLVESLAGAKQARHVLLVARYRLLDGSLRIPAPDGVDTGIAVPAGICLEPEERLLWTGRPQAVPWWFGMPDITASARGTVTVICAVLAAAGLLSGHPEVTLSMAPVYGIYQAGGRVLVRRRRIMRSTYVLTSKRLITVWQTGRSAPVVIEAPLQALLPPTLHGSDIYTTWHRKYGTESRQGWSDAWPAAKTHPPALIGISDPQAVRDLIATARLSMICQRTPNQ